MKEQTSLALAEPQTAITPLSMIQMALQQGASVEVLRDLFKLKQEVDADEARKAFLVAFAAFKAEAILITKNIAVTAGPLSGKRYADLFSVVSAITPALSKHGLSLSWKITKDEQNWLEVTCTVRHIQGHAESVSMGGPPDTGGAKNAIQARASAKTYLERYTALAIIGMAAAGEDIDGRAPKGTALPDHDYCSHMDAIQGANTVDELKHAYKAGYLAAEESGDQGAMAAFTKAKDNRKRELAR